MKIHTMQQGTDEWYAVRCGKITASNIKAVIAKGQGKTRELYMERRVAERLSGQPEETYNNKAMDTGKELEPQARAAYEDFELTIVEQVGFVELNEFVGCSPDGFVGKKGTIQIKCPFPSTHIHYIAKNKMPSDYVCQVQAELWVCGREWCDFVSFCPSITQKPLWKVRVKRDEAKIKEIKEGVDKFIKEMLELEKKIRGI